VQNVFFVGGAVPVYHARNCKIILFLPHWVKLLAKNNHASEINRGFADVIDQDKHL
jgi:hypothetical protein